MSALNFPSGAISGDTYQGYIFDGTRWTIVSAYIDHNDLDGRDSVDSHPLNAISGTEYISTVAATQAEMEAGTETALRSMSPLRVAQAVAALATTGVFPFYQADGSAAPIHLTGASALPFFVASGDAAHISLVI